MDGATRTAPNSWMVVLTASGRCRHRGRPMARRRRTGETPKSSPAGSLKPARSAGIPSSARKGTDAGLLQRPVQPLNCSDRLVVQIPSGLGDMTSPANAGFVVLRMGCGPRDWAVTGHYRGCSRSCRSVSAALAVAHLRRIERNSAVFYGPHNPKKRHSPYLRALRLLRRARVEASDDKNGDEYAVGLALAGQR